MNEIIIIAKLGDKVLIINKNDIPYIGKERALEVMSINVDLKNNEIGQILELEKHLKFNPWEEILDNNKRNLYLQILNTNFSDNEIIEKIIKPLAEKMIKSK